MSSGYGPYPTRRKAARPTGGGRPAPRILVVDDEAAVRSFVARALAHTGYEVQEQEDGTGALEALARNRFDLLITDIVMPGMDGIELALKVSKDYPDMAIMLMTGYADAQQRAYGLESLIHKVVAKPFTLKQICAAVDEALADAG